MLGGKAYSKSPETRLAAADFICARIWCAANRG
jgi:hypothetical protein